MNYTQNEKIEQVTDTTLVIGVDIGSQIHYARAFDNRGRELTKKVYSFGNSIEGFNSFIQWAEAIKTENSSRPSFMDTKTSKTPVTMSNLGHSYI